LVLENLDPENSGAAPESLEMHHAALSGLLAAYNEIWQGEKNQDEITIEIFAALGRLSYIRRVYFVGTAKGAYLNARFEELRGNKSQAEVILTGYTRNNPNCPEGHQYLAPSTPDMEMAMRPLPVLKLPF
jgi:hypothetical protein